VQWHCIKVPSPYVNQKIDYKSAQDQIEEEKKQLSAQECIEQTVDATCDAPAVRDGSSIQQSRKEVQGSPPECTSEPNNEHLLFTLVLTSTLD